MDTIPHFCPLLSPSFFVQCTDHFLLYLSTSERKCVCRSLYHIDITSFLANLPEALPEQANKRGTIVGCAFDESKLSENSVVPIPQTGETEISQNSFDK